MYKTFIYNAILIISQRQKSFSYYIQFFLRNIFLSFQEIKGEGMLVILEGEMVMTKIMAHRRGERDRETAEKGK